MKRHLLFLLFLSCSFALNANDGAYFASGNHLIPIYESDISIKKEILTLKKIRNQFIEVTVYYEFFNPKEAKNITVGFEAFSPEGDADGAPLNGHHPYMRDFTVDVNNKILNYKVAYVTDSLKSKYGKLTTVDLSKFSGDQTGNSVDFHYVYYFDATFKKGLNIVKHTYNYDLSGSVDYSYDFEYILTAAKRWANKQIDDFTLIIDMGEFETFSINKTFFNNANEWLINGIGRASDAADINPLVHETVLKCHMQKGNLIFHKKNFKIDGDLFVSSKRYFGYEDLAYLPFSYYQDENISAPKDEFQRKVLKNLPFARRGYVFQNKDLLNYFSKMDWYIPNKNYEPFTELLSENERLWIKKWQE